MLGLMNACRIYKQAGFTGYAEYKFSHSVECELDFKILCVFFPFGIEGWMWDVIVFS